MNNWTSVKEKMPPTLKRVIAAFKDGTVDITWCYETDSAITFLFDDIHGAVTHWMPIPKAPKEEGK